MLTLLVGIAGSVGAVSRVWVDGELKRHLRPVIPWQTMLINVTGSFLVGLLAGLVTAGVAGPNWQTVLATGFCGGYTTFSTASVETLTLVRSGRGGAALGYAVCSLVLALIACAIGLGVARLF
ncbi:fluoride efflux transporter CrcB [Jongsikchunia kroppenstedtii]|uniref:fluoride efflux transporter CrcB n=1 Tax=Jongsikchunia kroppenstedtii TaxID=1121721 RepID=UPI000373941A|nr:fluoride efflux transporter CrcB [Jongsikchunia kroppenstedtii]